MTWQIVALSSELGAKPVAVRFGADEYVLFREPDGRCRALLDRCAHRRAPLSIGRVTADGLLECPYHGWRYDGAGACRVIPNLSEQESVPGNYRVPAYPVAESGGLVLLWRHAGEHPTIPPPELEDSEQATTGRVQLAFPGSLYVDALLDSPSAVLELGRIAVIDEHRYGDPMLIDGHVVVSFAAGEISRLSRTPVLPDYPFVLRIEAPVADGAVRLTVQDTAGRALARALLAVVPRGARVSDVIWRWSGARPFQIAPRAVLEVPALARAGSYVSQFRQAQHGQAASSAAA